MVESPPIAAGFVATTPCYGESTMAEADRDDEAFVDALRRGDREAFARLVDEQSPRMLAVARRYLRDEDEARDVVQEAFVSAFRGIAAFAAGSRLSTWLHRITVNAALMRLRSRGRRPETSIEELLPRFAEDGHRLDPGRPWPETADVALERSETRALVRSAIDRLPETYRTVLLLRDIEQFDTGETAAMLDITTNAVKIRLHRARQALRELLAPHLGGGSRR